MSENKTPITYEAAYEELQQILRNIEQDNVSVDDLTTHLKRAKELFTFCKEKLYKTRTQVNELFEENQKE